MIDSKIRVLLAKPGLDGHDRGIKVIARGLRDAGMEVIYLGLRLAPEQIAEAAIQEDVDVVGLDCLTGAHMSLFTRTAACIREKGGEDIPIIVGGIIPQKDIAPLKDAGIAGVFGPGSTIEEIVRFIKNSFENENR